jgi:5-methylcytosine-specific restriction endonuclease McrA
MSAHVPIALSRKVRRRAKEICEYCRLPQSSQEATFHVDHVEPLSVGGDTQLENLALACVTCSLRKSCRVRVTDPSSGKTVRLFNPRREKWDDHFEFTAAWRIRGRSPTGRATRKALGMNRSAVVAIRHQLASLGRFPAY